MHARQTLSPALRRLIQVQQGVVSHRQLLEGGLSPRAVERLAKGWHRMARGIHLIGLVTDEPPLMARVWTGILLGGPGARAARLTAALLDDLAAPGERFRDRQGHWRVTDNEVEILVPGGPRGPRPGFLFLRESPGVRLPSAAREPHRTRIEDSVLDLCATSNEESAVMWLTRACQRRLTTADKLRSRLQERPNATSRAWLIEVLTDAAHGATSNLELHALREVFRPHGLPMPTLQHRTGTGNRVADAALPSYRLLIEFDGRLGHVEEGSFRDRLRDNAHTLDGWITLRFGWSDVLADPCGVARMIAQALHRLGWTGGLTRCPRCR
ncbi:MAG: DUF559 domain-containing protein [Kineosporiaceae bacterium]